MISNPPPTVTSGTRPAWSAKQKEVKHFLKHKHIYLMIDQVKLDLTLCLKKEENLINMVVNLILMIFIES